MNCRVISVLILLLLPVFVLVQSIESQAAGAMANSSAKADTISGGSIDIDTYWPADVYYVIDNLTVSAGATLTIAPGSIVKFVLSHRLVIQGGLVADNVVFTSWRDDTYGGDSNDDGPSVGVPGDWCGIRYASSATGGSLTSCLVRYAGYYNATPPAGHWGIAAYNCTAPVDLLDVTVEHTGAGDAAFYLTSPGTVSGCVAHDNAGYGYRVLADLMDDFSHNSNTQSSNGFENFVCVHSNVLNESATWSNNYNYLFPNYFTVVPGATLTLSAGSIVKFVLSHRLVIQGGLVADNVVFTSWRDDTYGGDSNGDGPSVGVPGDWCGIRYASSATGGSLTSCLVRYAGYYNSATPSGSWGIAVAGCTAPVDLIGVTVEHTGAGDAAVYLASPCTVTGSIVRNNLGDGIRISSSDTHLSSTDIYHDTGIGLQYSPADTLTAENCYWGHSTGPQHPDNPGGQGTVVTGNVDFIPWNTLPNTLVLDSVLQGIVTDLATGLPVAEAQVTLYPLFSGSSTVTSGTGSWSLDIPAGSGYELEVVADGYDDHITSDLSFEPGQTYQLDAQLTQLVSVDPDETLPQVVALEQNCPNPFNPLTRIRFSLPGTEHVSLKVYDARGRLVKVLVDGVRSGGRHEQIWRADDAQGRRVASGVYMYLLETAEGTRVRSMAVVQ